MCLENGDSVMAAHAMRKFVNGPAAWRDHIRRNHAARAVRPGKVGRQCIFLHETQQDHAFKQAARSHCVADERFEQMQRGVAGEESPLSGGLDFRAGGVGADRRGFSACGECFI